MSMYLLLCATYWHTKKDKGCWKKKSRTKKNSETKKNLASLSFSIWALNDSIRLRFDVDFWHEFFYLLKTHIKLGLEWNNGKSFRPYQLCYDSTLYCTKDGRKFKKSLQKSCKKFRSVNKSIVLNCQVRSTRTSRYHQMFQINAKL